MHGRVGAWLEEQGRSWRCHVGGSLNYIGVRVRVEGLAGWGMYLELS